MPFFAAPSLLTASNRVSWREAERSVIRGRGRGRDQYGTSSRTSDNVFEDTTVRPAQVYVMGLMGSLGIWNGMGCVYGIDEMCIWSIWNEMGCVYGMRWDVYMYME